jgi:hypothetical protein
MTKPTKTAFNDKTLHTHTNTQDWESNEDQPHSTAQQPKTKKEDRQFFENKKKIKKSHMCQILHRCFIQKIN